MKVLVVCHNDPGLHAGGTEIFAKDLTGALERRAGVRAFFLAGTDRLHRARRPGTLFQTVGDSDNSWLLWSGHFDRFTLQQRETYGVAAEVETLLATLRPDVVHIHHLLLVGLDFIHTVRRCLPNARIILTLHDFFLLCPHEGTMVRVRDKALCAAPSLDACRSCFPAAAPRDLKLRDLMIRQTLPLVDHVVAPSRFLLERVRAWGVDAGRSSHIANGRDLGPPTPPRPLPPGGRRDRFGYFGHVSPFKGARVALQAVQHLNETAQEGESGFSLVLHGGAEYQGKAFQAEVAEDLAACRGRAVQAGSYTADRLPQLIADVDWVIMPSIWWENAPLVIQEAFHHGRPVLCSDIGGMAEHVRDGVDGLHVPVGNPVAWAEAMRRAMADPDLWDSLRANRPTPQGLEACADAHLALYQGLMAAPSVAPTLAAS